MFESINVCDEPAPDLLVVVRLGSNALIDEHLAKSTAECHARWGIWGFFILEVADGDFAALARLRPIITTRRRLLAAHGQGDEAPLRARVIKRHGDRVSLQIQLGAESAAVA